MMFQDRDEAGGKLAECLLHRYAKRKDVIVLGIPRGGVPVAFQVAKALDAPLDIFLSHKLGVPGQPELAFGAVASGDTKILDPQIVEAFGISDQQIEQIAGRVRKELDRRESLYRGDRLPLKVDGMTVLLVDDGIATGSSMLAAVQALRQMKPAAVVVAVPVAPETTCNRLRANVDEFVCVYTPPDCWGVGQFYEDFSQVSDQDVARLLRYSTQSAVQSTPQGDLPGAESRRTMIPGRTLQWDGSKREVSIYLPGATLEGTLVLPKNANGLVLFAHGSGSSRHSPRNRYVAEFLNSQQTATLLFDLLTVQEEATDRYTGGQFRFNIPFLANRLIGATKSIVRSPDTKRLKVGYFGASTGAAAALLAAAELPDLVSAVVSRGGRPDLAEGALEAVRSPTLFIVGGDDEPVITMNRAALAKLRIEEKKLVIIPGATHLFEEEGALEQVAHHAAQWFSQHFENRSDAAAAAVHESS